MVFCFVVCLLEEWSLSKANKKRDWIKDERSRDNGMKNPLSLDLSPSGRKARNENGKGERFVEGE